MSGLTAWWSDLVDMMSQSLRVPTHGSNRRTGGKPAARGWLVPMGGDAIHDDVVVGLIHLAGGRREPAVVLAPDGAGGPGLGQGLVHALQRFGMEQTRLLPLAGGTEAWDREVVQQIATARLILLGGGDPVALVANLAGTPVRKALQYAYQQGAVVAAAGSAAAALGAQLPPAGEGADSPLLSLNGYHEEAGTASLDLFPMALQLSNTLIIDSQVIERNRLGRLLYGAAQNPDLLALGLAENTAAFIGPMGDLRVQGAGVAVVVDGRKGRGAPGPAASGALRDLNVHVLPAGYGFDLASRRPLPPATAAGEAGFAAAGN